MGPVTKALLPALAVSFTACPAGHAVRADWMAFVSSFDSSATPSSATFWVAVNVAHAGGKVGSGGKDVSPAHVPSPPSPAGVVASFVAASAAVTPLLLAPPDPELEPLAPLDEASPSDDPLDEPEPVPFAPEVEPGDPPLDVVTFVPDPPLELDPQAASTSVIQAAVAS
jgi:hypothetical protein